MIQDLYSLHLLRVVVALLQAAAAGEGQALPAGRIAQILGNQPADVEPSLYRTHVHAYLAKIEGAPRANVVAAGSLPAGARDVAIEALAIAAVQDKHTRFGSWAAVQNHYATIGHQFEGFVAMENQFSEPQHNTKDMK